MGFFFFLKIFSDLELIFLMNLRCENLVEGARGKWAGGSGTGDPARRLVEGPAISLPTPVHE